MTEGVAFETLPRRSQIHRMRAVALDAIVDYPIEPDRLRLAHHGHNTTFRVDTVDGRRFALRVNLNSRSTPANLRAETAWLTALAHDTDLAVPIPLETHHGSSHTSRRCSALDRDLSVVVMSWLPGRHVEPPTTAAARELGRVTAVLHDHAASWTLPAGAGFPSHASVLLDDPNRIQSEHPLLTAPYREVVDEALTRTQAQFDLLHSSAPSHVLHADLHLGNVKWRRGRLGVFDFDDAVHGAPALDLGISAYYLGTESDLESKLLEGYETERPLPPFEHDQFQAVLAGRNLLLLNEILGAVTSNIRAVQQRYVDNTVKKLAAYLETGVYRHAVAGVVPLEF
ncbi:hypothetical protein BH23ACT3_BH23ACT3_04370 [soil metagenome]